MFVEAMWLCLKIKHENETKWKTSIHSDKNTKKNEQININVDCCCESKNKKSNDESSNTNEIFLSSCLEIFSHAN